MNSLAYAGRWRTAASSTDQGITLNSGDIASLLPVAKQLGKLLK